MAVECRDIWFEGAFMRLLVSSEDSGGQLSIMEQWLPAGHATPTHVHQREDQTLHVLEGTLSARVGDTRKTLTAGESIFLPRRIPHALKAGSAGAKCLEINTPAGFEQFHIEVGEPAPEPRLPPAKDPDVEVLAAAIARFDGAIVGPPMD